MNNPFDLKSTTRTLHGGKKHRIKEMQNCNHEWQPVTGQPTFKCAHCGIFMVIIK
jgi:hypothetical protein